MKWRFCYNSPFLSFASCLAVSMATKQFFPSWITPGLTCWLKTDRPRLLLLEWNWDKLDVAFETILLLNSKAALSSSSLTDLMLRLVFFGLGRRTRSESSSDISLQQIPLLPSSRLQIFMSVSSGFSCAEHWMAGRQTSLPSHVVGTGVSVWLRQSPLPSQVVDSEVSDRPVRNT